MRRLLLATVLVALTPGMAFAADILTVSAGPDSFTVNSSGVCTGDTGTGCTGIATVVSATSITSVGPIDGWTINIDSGVTHSPSLTPVGLDLSVTASCSGACSALTVSYGDTGFTVVAPLLTNVFNAGSNSAGETSTGSIYFNPANTLGTGASGSPLQLGAILSSTVTSVGGSSTTLPITGPGPTTTPYSLILVDTAAACTDCSISVSSDNRVTSNVPEPASLLLMGSGLLGLTTTLRKRAKKS